MTPRKDEEHSHVAELVDAAQFGSIPNKWYRFESCRDYKHLKTWKKKKKYQ